MIATLCWNNKLSFFSKRHASCDVDGHFAHHTKESTRQFLQICLRARLECALPIMAILSVMDSLEINANHFFAHVIFGIHYFCHVRIFFFLSSNYISYIRVCFFFSRPSLYLVSIAVRGSQLQCSDRRNCRGIMCAVTRISIVFHFLRRRRSIYKTVKSAWEWMRNGCFITRGLAAGLYLAVR